MEHLFGCVWFGGSWVGEGDGRIQTLVLVEGNIHGIRLVFLKNMKSLWSEVKEMLIFGLVW